MKILRIIVLTLIPKIAFAEIAVGATEALLIRQLGKPEATTVIGNRAIYRWGQKQYYLKDGIVTAIKELPAPEPSPTPEKSEVRPVQERVLSGDHDFGVEFTQVEFRWRNFEGADKGSSGLSPEIRFSVQNKSEKDLKYLAVKFVFMEDSSKIFDEAEETVVGPLDTPLPSHITSKTHFVSTGQGYTVYNYAWGSNVETIKSKRYQVVMYVKLNESWDKFTEFAFETR